MKRNLPKMDMGARPGVRSDIKPGVISRWDANLSAMDDNSGGSIAILDAIGVDFWGEGITAKTIAPQLRAFGSAPVTVTINSPGGDVFEGIAIYNLLREYRGEVTIKIVGLAASAASIVAMAGDRVLIGRSAFLMIHNSWVCACGDRNAFREIADWLEPFDAAMAEVYAHRTGRVAADVIAMMDAETWINGTAAVDGGFADDFLSSDDVMLNIPEEDAKALRAERRFDLVAGRAGLSRSEARALLNDVKGGKPGAALTGKLEAAEIEAGLSAIRDLLKS